MATYTDPEVYLKALMLEELRQSYLKYVQFCMFISNWRDDTFICTIMIYNSALYSKEIILEVSSILNMSCEVNFEWSIPFLSFIHYYCTWSELILTEVVCFFSLINSWHMVFNFGMMMYLTECNCVLWFRPGAVLLGDHEDKHDEPRSFF